MSLTSWLMVWLLALHQMPDVQDFIQADIFDILKEKEVLLALQPYDNFDHFHYSQLLNAFSQTSFLSG